MLLAQNQFVLGALSAGLAVATGCSSSVQVSPPAAAIASARVQSQTNPYRPRLTLVEREGDPSRGLALAVHVAAAPAAVAMLSWLVEGRLRGAGFDRLSTQTSSSGFVVYALGDDEAQVARFLRDGNRALLTPVSATDAEHLAAHLAREPLAIASSASEALLAQCAGEPLYAPGSEGTRGTAADVSKWLDGVRVGDVAFAVVGSRKYLDAATDAAASLTAWTRLGSSRWNMPGADQLGSVRATGPLTLSVALSGGPPAPLMATAERIAQSESLFATRLGAGFPAWQVASVSTHLDAGSACLRVDLQSTGAAPTAEAVAHSAWSALDELQHTLPRVDSGAWVIAKQVLAAESPLDAAAVAAWQALNAEGQSTELHRLVHYAGDLAPPASSERLAELFAAAAPSERTGPEAASEVEPGQANFWMLLASPCGTSAEDAATAGTLALALHSTALSATGSDGVVLEPWLNVDAVGILAHAPAASARESPEAQAERVAEALARALLRPGPSPEAISASREVLLGTLATGPTPAWSLALRQTSGNHPSWLDARGSWSTLSALSARSVELQREAFLRGRLRLASIGNHDEAQIAAGEQRLRSLLHGAESGRAACLPRRPVLPVAGQYRVEAPAQRNTDAVIAVPLPTSAEGLPEEALWTEWLMNRTDGWLRRALLLPGLVSTARARVLGGVAAAALVIELRALDGKRDVAVAQVRGLLGRLRAGAATGEDAQQAQESLERRRAELALNPRARVVELWRRGLPHARPGTLEGLHALHRFAFEPGREVVVLTDPPP
ncbi:MAG TPA: hypothetical protein VFS67_25395 [Polyangiaceae bacterium]|nr:hypothetical protein [Polyangiaceae bacterium]